MNTVTTNTTYRTTGIRITFVIVGRNSIEVAVEINVMCVNTNKCNVVSASRTRKL